MADPKPDRKNLESQIAYYLERYHQGEGETAFQSLLEMSDAVLPALMTEYHQTDDISFRVFLLHVIWQHRQASVIPFLEKALGDPQSEVWKEALDGLVALASPASLEVIRRAKDRSFSHPFHKEERDGWIDEAFEQAKANWLEIRDQETNQGSR